ncbi:MAG: acetyl-CoA carboxylase biotin carboxyl carrier protein [Proteobacteria bacterium]|nr:acetyl-CoA carboxylase biotin carboxyl carrier protein [Pseudomonadota bacterium]
MSRIPVDPEAIRQLASILAETGLSEIEIADKENRIRIARAPVAPAPGIVHVPQSAASAPAMPGASSEAGVPKGAVTSPMVGVAYLAPEPGAANYVAVGQAVSAGQTLLLIEAMKTFNQIKAPSAGTVTRILVASGSPVEYGEPLMVIEP